MPSRHVPRTQGPGAQTKGEEGQAAFTRLDPSRMGMGEFVEEKVTGHGDPGAAEMESVPSKLKWILRSG